MNCRAGFSLRRASARLSRSSKWVRRADARCGRKPAPKLLQPLYTSPTKRTAGPRYSTNNSPMAFQSTYSSPCAPRVEDGVFWKALGWGERLEAVLLLTALGPFLIATGV